MESNLRFGGGLAASHDLEAARTPSRGFFALVLDLGLCAQSDSSQVMPTSWHATRSRSRDRARSRSRTTRELDGYLRCPILLCRNARPRLNSATSPRARASVAS